MGPRTHLSLEKDAPVARAVDRASHILCRPTLGGLHHQYAPLTTSAKPLMSLPSVVALGCSLQSFACRAVHGVGPRLIYSFIPARARMVLLG